MKANILSKCNIHKYLITQTINLSTTLNHAIRSNSSIQQPLPLLLFLTTTWELLMVLMALLFTQQEVHQGQFKFTSPAELICLDQTVQTLEGLTKLMLLHLEQANLAKKTRDSQRTIKVQVQEETASMSISLTILLLDPKKSNIGLQLHLQATMLLNNLKVINRTNLLSIHHHPGLNTEEQVKETIALLQGQELLTAKRGNLLSDLETRTNFSQHSESSCSLRENLNAQRLILLNHALILTCTMLLKFLIKAPKAGFKALT